MDKVVRVLTQIEFYTFYHKSKIKKLIKKSRQHILDIFILS